MSLQVLFVCLFVCFFAFFFEMGAVLYSVLEEILGRWAVQDVFQTFLDAHFSTIFLAKSAKTIVPIPGQQARSYMFVDKFICMYQYVSVCMASHFRVCVR